MSDSLSLDSSSSADFASASLTTVSLSPLSVSFKKHSQDPNPTHSQPSCSTTMP